MVLSSMDEMLMLLMFFNPFILELFVYPPEGEGQKPEDAVEEIQKEHRKNQQQIQER